uniref:(northern house mosquito) hypothetical protein n=1 Tax=Culex pipiens TaxID=7175 RepID=A0A8D8JZC6_CULPI
MRGSDFFFPPYERNHLWRSAFLASSVLALKIFFSKYVNLGGQRFSSNVSYKTLKNFTPCSNSTQFNESSLRYTIRSRPGHLNYFEVLIMHWRSTTRLNVVPF